MHQCDKAMNKTDFCEEIHVDVDTGQVIHTIHTG